MLNILYSFYLSFLGDCIGSQNLYNIENLKLNYLSSYQQADYLIQAKNISFLLVYIYIDNGCFTNIINKIKNNELFYTHSTYFNITTLISLNSNDFLKSLINEYTQHFKDIKNIKSLQVKNNTINFLKEYISDNSIINTYYPKNIDNHTICHSLSIALFYHSNIDNIIKYCILLNFSQNNILPIISSISYCFFIKLALEQVNIDLWIPQLFDFLKSDYIITSLQKLKPNFIPYYDETLKNFINKFKTYYEDNFNDNIYIYNEQRSISPANRSFYYNKFSNNKHKFYLGSYSDDCLIISYDILQLCKNNYEKLVIFSTYLIGDSHVICFLSSSLYGAFYGSNGLLEEIKNIIPIDDIILEYNDNPINIKPLLFKK